MLKKLKIDSKWSEMRKEHETGDAEFLLVLAVGGRPFLYVYDVITCYHTESINKAVN